jgi:hypothetical protein
MTIQIAGQTTHFTVGYDDAVGAPALAVANAVLAICEIDLFRLSHRQTTWLECWRPRVTFAKSWRG